MTENKRFYLDENGINDREYEFSILGEDELVDIINELNDENIELHIQNDFLKVENQHMRDLIIENKQLKQQIKDLRLGVLDSIHEAEEIQCCCNPCVVEECVKKVIE